jgi:hypothetical protein
VQGNVLEAVEVKTNEEPDPKGSNRSRTSRWVTETAQEIEKPAEPAGPCNQRSASLPRAATCPGQGLNPRPPALPRAEQAANGRLPRGPAGARARARASVRGGERPMAGCHVAPHG